jgi:hypothetical protein
VPSYSTAVMVIGKDLNPATIATVPKEIVVATGFPRLLIEA